MALVDSAKVPLHIKYGNGWNQNIQDDDNTDDNNDDDDDDDDDADLDADNDKDDGYD